MSSSTRDNWQRLVEAVMKRELYLELAHKPYSRNTSINTVASDYTDQILDLESATPSPSPSPSPHQVPPTKRPPLIPQEKKNASGPITWKLFSTLQRRRKPKDNYLDSIPEDLQLHLTRLRRFSLHELQLATDNFSNRNILRRGGFGKAYKGRLVDGLLVVVKRRKLKKITIQLEVATIAAHCNILCVYGFCFTKKECVLIFPYMTNGSVASLLRERPAHQPCLNWLTRKEIALGTARGLAYLHDECESGRIIHCDIKAANILLNEDFEVVIADFGFAMIMDQYSTGVLRDVVKGTIGHIPPECLSPGEFSEKNDVFGYGVFLLELITGQRAFDLARVTNDEDVMLLDWVKKYFKEKQWKMVADPDSGGDDMEEVVEQLSVISLLCTQHSPEGRPKMSEIVRMLEVGDVYGERWEAWCNPVETVDESVGLNMHDDTWTTESVGLNMYDDTLTLPPFQLSEPR